jgi:hypothetical protein
MIRATVLQELRQMRFEELRSRSPSGEDAAYKQQWACEVSRLGLKPRYAGSVQVDEIEPEIIRIIDMVEFESARFLIIHGDPLQPHGTGRGNRHRQPIHGVRLVVRLNFVLQRNAEGQPLLIHVLHLHPDHGVLGMLEDQRLQTFHGRSCELHG